MSRPRSPLTRSERNRLDYLRRKALGGLPAKPSPGDHNRHVDADKWDGVLFCDRCDRPLVETIEPTEARAGEPPMNLHTYRCASPACRPRRKRIEHGAYSHVCNPHPDPAVRIQVRLPQVMARHQLVLTAPTAEWDEPLDELPANLRGSKDTKHRPKPSGRVALGKRR